MAPNQQAETWNEIPIAFNCEGDRLYGIVHNAKSPAHYGVLVVLGGPQTRVGSHRQFVLLARTLAANNIPVMRFDYRGIGDATGNPRTFQNIDTDIRCAIDTFIEHQSKISKVVIWGLCDAASAAMFYAFRDHRVQGLVLLNPDTLTTTSTAKTYLKHYYLQKFFDRKMWKKIVRGQFDYRDSFWSLMALIANLFGSEQKPRSGEKPVPFPQRMRESLARFGYPILLILSGRDLTADAFRDLIKDSSQWREILAEQKRATCFTLEQADHTFSAREWRRQVESLTLDWIQHLP